MKFKKVSMTLSLAFIFLMQLSPVEGMETDQYGTFPVIKNSGQVIPNPLSSSQDDIYNEEPTSPFLGITFSIPPEEETQSRKLEQILPIFAEKEVQTDDFLVEEHVFRYEEPGGLIKTNTCVGYGITLSTLSFVIGFGAAYLINYECNQ